MTDDRTCVKNTYKRTELSISPHIAMDNDTYDYYIVQHQLLSKMKKNQLNLYGIDLNVNQDDEIIVRSFIRSTVEKSIRLKTAPIVLLGQDGTPFAKTAVDFSDLGVLPPNISRPWTFIFPAESRLKQIKDRNKLRAWSLAFEHTTEHTLDLSDMDNDTISELSRAKLEQIAREAPLVQGELSFMGLSATQNVAGEVNTTVLIRNGTMRDLKLNQVPFKLYDSGGDLSAMGTFRLADLTIQANTSKPATFVFPESSIIKKQMDLSNWALQHVE